MCCLFNLQILISHGGASRTPKLIKMDIFMLTTNDSQSVTVFRKNFVLNASGVLDLRVIDFNSDLK